MAMLRPEKECRGSEVPKEKTQIRIKAYVKQLPNVMVKLAIMKFRIYKTHYKQTNKPHYI